MVNETNIAVRRGRDDTFTITETDKQPDQVTFVTEYARYKSQERQARAQLENIRQTVSNIEKLTGKMENLIRKFTVRDMIFIRKKSKQAYDFLVKEFPELELKEKESDAEQS